MVKEGTVVSQFRWSPPGVEEDDRIASTGIR